ncbi:MAG TPA: lipopolysaccharide heptosyltransferase II [Thermoanaerobaculia bacterium]|nr:lipopolysaccharide heptosyltransferase II [Thermoanaerobaculia bacterium]
MRTLLRATNWVGDVAMSLPALKALRAAFPGDHLAVLARPWVADLYRLRREIDQVLVEEPAGAHAAAEGRRRLAAELRELRFDRAVLFPTSFGTAWTVHQAGIPERLGWAAEGRGPLLTTALPPRLFRGRHQVWKHLLLAEAAGAPLPAAPDASWEVAGETAAAGRAVLAAAGWNGRPFVAAHVASFAHAAKRWELAGFAAVFDRLAGEKGLETVLLGSAGESAVNGEAAALARRTRVLDLSGKSSLPEALGILSLARLFVGNDSGLGHLAAAAGTPTVVVFGPTDPDATRPWDGPRGDGRPVRIAAARRRTACAPCRFDVCPIDHRCMSELPAGRVFEAAAALL